MYNIYIYIYRIECRIFYHSNMYVIYLLLFKLYNILCSDFLFFFHLYFILSSNKNKVFYNGVLFVCLFFVNDAACQKSILILVTLLTIYY